MPTWRIVPGTCRHSLALLVAQQCGVSQEIVDRADELYRVSHLLAKHVCNVMSSGQAYMFSILSQDAIFFLSLSFSPSVHVWRLCSCQRRFFLDCRV